MERHRNLWQSLLKISFGMGLPVAVALVGWQFYIERRLSAQATEQHDVSANQATTIAVMGADVNRMGVRLDKVDARTERIEATQQRVVTILERVEKKVGG